MQIIKKTSLQIILLALAISITGCAQDTKQDSTDAEETELLEKPMVSSAGEHEETVADTADEPAEDPSGIDWVSLEEAQKQAKENGKKILIFGYADWCPYCKQMRRETYTDEEVRKRLYKEFIPVELNAEIEDSIRFNGMDFKSWELAQAFQIYSYPMHIFIDPDGEVLGAQPGFLPADIFGPLLTYIGEDLFGKVDFEEYLKETENVVIEP